MEILFAEGTIDVDRAREAFAKCASAFAENPWLANAQSIANYVLPDEANGFEGHLRFVIPRENEDASEGKSILRVYFSPRALQPYRIVFVYVTNQGKVGFNASNHSWTQQAAAQLRSTGVWKRELPKPAYGAEPLND